jgi:hypothetical protein
MSKFKVMEEAESRIVRALLDVSLADAAGMQGPRDPPYKPRPNVGLDMVSLDPDLAGAGGACECAGGCSVSCEALSLLCFLVVECEMARRLWELEGRQLVTYDDLLMGFFAKVDMRSGVGETKFPDASLLRLSSKLRQVCVWAWV